MGGRSATFAPEEAVSALRALIARLRIEDSGRFFAQDGRELGW
jgi:hypothetical protein